jgi:hypothetical protein
MNVLPSYIATRLVSPYKDVRLMPFSRLPAHFVFACAYPAAVIDSSDAVAFIKCTSTSYMDREMSAFEISICLILDISNQEPTFRQTLGSLFVSLKSPLHPLSHIVWACLLESCVGDCSDRAVVPAVGCRAPAVYPEAHPRHPPPTIVLSSLKLVV